MKYIDQNNWNRKQHFEFFSQFEEPFWGITTSVDITLAAIRAKEKNCSLFIYYLYQAICASNSIENFRYRITPENKVVLYDHIGASATILRSDETFGFTYIPYAKDLHTFMHEAQNEIDRVQSTTDLFPPQNPIDVIHYSAIPWLNFTSLSHARSFKTRDSVPKISFGKITVEDTKKYMALSIHAHHGLVDGIHIGHFVSCFQELLNL